MMGATPWNDDTPDREFARVLPPRGHERWIVVGFWLLVIAVVAVRVALPDTFNPSVQPAVQATMK